jgi:hypothetical protein
MRASLFRFTRLSEKFGRGPSLWEGKRCDTGKNSMIHHAGRGLVRGGVVRLCCQLLTKDG